MLDYNKPSKKDAKRISQNNYEIEKKLKDNVNRNPYQGTIVKRGTYTYGTATKTIESSEESNYEEKVNEFLDELNQASQNNVDTLVNGQKMSDAVKQICPNSQNSADALVQQQVAANRVSEIVRQGSSQEIARKILADRDER